MTAFTITTSVNYTSLTGRTGSDTYNVNGGTVTIDSDVRYGPNVTATTGAFGNIILSATLGGNLIVDGTNIWQIQISGGSGNIPAAGTIITQGSVTAELMVVMSTQYGGAVKASGSSWNSAAGHWVKIRGMAGGILTTGAATLSGGSSITISVAPVRSFIELCGVEALTLTVNRLNKFTATGDWWYVLDSNGNQVTTTGVRGESYQLPAFTAHNIYEYGGVEIETAPGSGIYEHWVNTSYKFSSTNHSTDSRCKYVRISNTGLLTLGQDSGAASAGFMPVAGCRIRIPNIVCTNCNATAGYGVNVAPNATMGTRYEINTSSSGVVDIRKVTGAWYWNVQQPYSVYIRDMHTCEQMVLSEPSTPADIAGLMVGMSNQTAPYGSNSIVFQQCMNGGTLSNVTGVRAEQVSTSGYSGYFVNLYGGWTINNIRITFASAATAMSGSLFFNTCDSMRISNVYVVGKRLLMSACTNWTLDNVYYADNPVGTTGTTLGSYFVELMAGCRYGVVTNIANWPGVADVHAYAGVVIANTCNDLVITGIGTSSTPLQCGSTATTRSGYLYSDTGLSKNIKVQRCWVQNLRTGLYNSTNTSQNIRMQNCYNVDASLTQGPNWYNSTVRGNRQNSGTVPTGFTHVDGMHFYDAFTSDTTARAFLVLTEMSTSTAGSYVVNSGTPKFTSTGVVVMASIGDQITWTWSYFILGWSSLTTTAMTGTNTASNYTYEYDLDKGSGFSGTWKSLTNANLAAETGISPTIGFKPRVRITCTIAASNNQVSSLVINGTTTLAQQNAALYPLDAIGLTLTSVLFGSDVVVYDAGTTTVLDTGDSISGTSYTYGYLVPRAVDIGIFKAGFLPYFIRNYQLSTTPTSIPVAQVADRSYT